jgi:hypothetical protein
MNNDIKNQFAAKVAASVDFKTDLAKKTFIHAFNTAVDIQSSVAVVFPEDQAELGNDVIWGISFTNADCSRTDIKRLLDSVAMSMAAIHDDLYGGRVAFIFNKPFDLYQYMKMAQEAQRIPFDLAAIGRIELPSAHV